MRSRSLPVSRQELGLLRKELEELGEIIERRQLRAKLEKINEELERGIADYRQLSSLLKQRKYLETVVTQYDKLCDEMELLEESYDMILEDLELIDDWIQMYNELRNRIQKLKMEFLLSDELDMNDAILMLHAGTGGTDAQDWTDMLMRMYMAWARKRGFKVKILDIQPGNEAGIKSATLLIEGPNAYGLLKGEGGAHRLVRLSPFNANNKRQTSFALVEVIPKLDDEINIQIKPEDLKIETFKAGGHGGQHVNRNETAVRITHIPTGITVVCSNERSQHQNKDIAMRILKSRLYQLEKKRREEEIRQLKGNYRPTWGNQIRSYVLHPYKLVKDLRTNCETSKVDDVLNGEIDDFIYKWLLWKSVSQTSDEGGKKYEDPKKGLL